MYRSARPSYRQPLKTPAQPVRSRRRIAIILLLSAGALIVVAAALFFGMHDTKDDTTNTNKNPATQQSNTEDNQPATSQPQQPPAFNKQMYSTTDASSMWVVVNKKHALEPKSYTPANLVVPNIPLRSNITGNEKYVRADVARALEQMVADAKNAGVTFNLQSGYRSYNFQTTLYNGYIKSQGQAVADRQSARPGHSEHQTGLAADLGGITKPACNVEACYADTPEGMWLAANGYKYGFIIRYTPSKESVTGYMYEPWHIRYVGTELAAEMHRTGMETLEEFFGISGGTAY